MSIYAGISSINGNFSTFMKAQTINDLTFGTLYSIGPNWKFSGGVSLLMVTTNETGTHIFAQVDGTYVPFVNGAWGESVKASTIVHIEKVTLADKGSVELTISDTTTGALLYDTTLVPILRGSVVFGIE